MAVIDTAKREIVGRIGVGSGPIQMYATPDGARVYVANQGTTDEPADAVSVSEVSTQSIIDTIQTGAGAHSVVISDDGRFVVVTNIVDGTVSVIEVAARRVRPGSPASAAAGATSRDVTMKKDESRHPPHRIVPGIQNRAWPRTYELHACAGPFSARPVRDGGPETYRVHAPQRAGERRLLAHAELISRSPAFVFPSFRRRNRLNDINYA